MNEEKREELLSWLDNCEYKLRCMDYKPDDIQELILVNTTLCDILREMLTPEEEA